MARVVYLASHITVDAARMLLYSTLACLDSARRCWSLESGLLIMSEAPSDAAVRLVAVLEVRLGLGRDLAWWVGGVSLFVVEMLRYGAVSAVCRYYSRYDYARWIDTSS